MGILVSTGCVLGILVGKMPRILGPAWRALDPCGLRRPGFSYGLGNLLFIPTSATGNDCADHVSPSPASRLRAAGEIDCSI